MSMPNIPHIDCDINISKNDALNVILASIGFEELGLAHLINAEAEKIQYALGTLETAECGAQPFEKILEVNKSVEDVLKTTIKMQLLLSMKLEETLEAYEPCKPVKDKKNCDK